MSDMQKHSEVIKRAVEQRDAVTLLKVANYLRFAKGMNYREIHEFINRSAPIELAEYDSLLREAEEDE